MAEEESSSVEIKLISGEDLRAFNFFQKLSIFALASISSDDPAKKVGKSQLQRTPTDRDNDGFPEWNHEIRFLFDSDSDSDHLFVHLDLRHEGVLFGIGDKTIGEVRIPLKDLTDYASSSGIVRIVRYQVRSADGKPNGVVKLSYKFNSKTLKVRYPTVEEVPDLDLIDPKLSLYHSSSPSHDYCSSFPIPQRHGIGDFWPSPAQTTPYRPAYVPYANPQNYYHGAMWDRGSVMGEWN